MKKLGKTLLFAAIGFAIGLVIGQCLDQDTKYAMAVVGMGVPFGWPAISRWFGTLIIGGGVGMIIFLGLKFIVSALLGWILMPIEIGKGLYEIATNRS